ncbi:MAG: EamA family transporter RarD [Amphritea sp.]
MQHDQEHKKGVYFAIAAYGMWGLVPIYFKALEHVSSLEVLAHRVIWSVALLTLVLAVGSRWRKLMPLLKQPKIVGALTLTAVIVSVNWLVFIWAVSQGRILETSLGYFINPLVSVFLGMLFLQERLRPGQWMAILFAAFGVGYQLFLLGNLPWVALVLAFSFGFYGLLRKQIPVDAVSGLFIETLLLLPVAGIYLFWLAQQGQLQFFNEGTSSALLLLAAGIVTSLPLLCFTAAARRLSLTLIGLLQYIGPSITFFLAVFYYHEPMDSNRMITFLFIWAALVIITIEGVMVQQRKRVKNKEIA